MLDAEQVHHGGLVFAGHGETFGCLAVTLDGGAEVHSNVHATIAQQIRKPMAPAIPSITRAPASQDRT